MITIYNIATGEKANFNNANLNSCTKDSFICDRPMGSRSRCNWNAVMMYYIPLNNSNGKVYATQCILRDGYAIMGFDKKADKENENFFGYKL